MKIDLMKLAEQAGFTVMDWGQIRIKHSNGSWVSVTEELTEFARLVLANAAEDAKPAPDVAPLVEALERIGGVRTDYAAALAREALAAWKSQK